MADKIFSNKPYQKQYSYDFITAAKNGNFQVIQSLLSFNKYLEEIK